MFHFYQMKSTFLMISLIGRHLVTRTIDQIESLVYENNKKKHLDWFHWNKKKQHKKYTLPNITTATHE